MKTKSSKANSKIDRNKEITKFSSKEKLGIEIAPWHSPITPKSEGFNCLTLDVFDYETLLNTAKEDPNVNNDQLKKIEPVDLVGSADDIETLAANKGVLGKIDYIVSSHNFEHLPNPIKFLIGCEKALKEGGHLCMAIPDKRVCFDAIRPLTSLSDFIEAFFNGNTMPSPKQVFDSRVYSSSFFHRNNSDYQIKTAITAKNIYPHETLEIHFDDWKNSLGRTFTYKDAHCWTFIPESLELILNDLIYLNLINYEIVEVSRTNINEFFVHLKKISKNNVNADKELFYSKRRTLLFKQLRENSRSYGEFKESLMEKLEKTLEHQTKRGYLFLKRITPAAIKKPIKIILRR